MAYIDASNKFHHLSKINNTNNYPPVVIFKLKQKSRFPE